MRAAQVVSLRERRRRTQSVYLVLIRVAPTNRGDPNTEVYAAKLRRRDADELARTIPGAWVEKVIADRD